VGQRISRGQPIAKVGDAEGIFAYHLHYDISPTRILETEPWHWPKLDRDELLKHYIDPKAFTEEHRPPMR
jgi:murein DD-endopeptidase MepM/ murein hydrolase activator NlpD